MLTRPLPPQEEFEGAALARSALETITDVYEREAAERKVKLRTMGNIRLIGELYKSKMIGERILQSCISELLGKQTKTDPPEENVEALINLLITGALLSRSIPRTRSHLSAPPSRQGAGRRLLPLRRDGALLPAPAAARLQQEACRAAALHVP